MSRQDRPRCPWLAATLVAMGLLAACRPATPLETGALAVAVELPASRTLVPAGDYTPADYHLEGAGPQGAAFTQVLTQTTTTVEGLVAGDWTLTATARDAQGSPVARGETTAVIPAGGSVEVVIVLGIAPGEGRLEITLLWPSELAEPRLEADLLDQAGVLDPLDAPGDTAPGTSLLSVGDVASGWYTLLVRVTSAGVLAAGVAEAVLIRPGVTTTGTLDLRSLAPDGSGAAGIGLVMEPPRVTRVVMAGQHGTVAPGQALTVEGWPALAGWQGWFLDGCLVGTGDALVHPAPQAGGHHRLDTVVVHGSEAGSAAVSFTVAPATPAGALTRAYDLVDGDWGTQGLRGARSAAVSPDGLRVYASGYDADTVAVFGRSTATGRVHYTGRAPPDPALDGADGLALSPEGTHLYVAAYTADTLVVLEPTPDGNLTAIAYYPGLDGVRSVVVSGDGRHVYAALAAADTLAVFARDAATGGLTAAGAVPTGGTPTDIALSPDDRHLYIAEYGGDGVAWLTRDPGTGALTAGGACRDGVAGVDGLNGAHGVVVSTDGAWVYVVSYYDRSLVAFGRDAVTGALTPVTRATDGVDGVDGLAYARDVETAGGAIWVAGGGDDAVAFFRATPLGPVFGETVSLPDGPRGLGVSPLGDSLYAVCSTAGSLTLLSVSP